IVQLMPGATDDDISRLETNIAACPSMTTMLHSGMEIEEIAARVLDGFAFENLETVPVEYRCNCSEERVHRALISLGKEELIRLRDEKEEDMTVTCQFCDKVYTIDKAQMTEMIESL
ncbi:MAG: Hsp33 family molecular chaperone HslO, partial [Butyricicoccaceae bacterium]